LPLWCGDGVAQIVVTLKFQEAEKTESRDKLMGLKKKMFGRHRFFYKAVLYSQDSDWF
jgi:hypothetical protein